MFLLRGIESGSKKSHRTCSNDGLFSRREVVAFLNAFEEKLVIKIKYSKLLEMQMSLIANHEYFQYFLQYCHNHISSKKIACLTGWWWVSHAYKRERG